MPGLAWGIAGTAGHLGYREQCFKLLSPYLWLCWPQLKYFREWMEGKQTALLRAFSSAASAKLRKNNKLIREMLKMERGRLQPQAQ